MIRSQSKRNVYSLFINKAIRNMQITAFCAVQLSQLLDFSLGFCVGSFSGSIPFHSSLLCWEQKNDYLKYFLQKIVKISGVSGGKWPGPGIWSHLSHSNRAHCCYREIYGHCSYPHIGNFIRRIWQQTNKDPSQMDAWPRVLFSLLCWRIFNKFCIV